MRVLNFRSTFTFAGPEAGLLRLGVPLQTLGVVPKIIAHYRQRAPEPTVHRLVEEGQRRGLDVEQWDDRSRFSWRTVRRLTDELERGGHDLLVTHDHKSNLLGYLAARRAGVPCLAHAHGYDLSLFRMRLYRRLDLLVLRLFPRVVAVSAALRRELLAAGVPADRVHVVHNAIDVEEFGEGAVERGAAWRRQWGGSSGPVILTVARLFAGKGLEDFVQAAAIVHAVTPQARFWIVGDGARRPWVRAQIQRLALDGVVSLLGAQRDIAAIMAASDVIVSASHAEGLPNVLLEAMALSKPVVATRVGGVPELVRDGETGWLVAPRRPDALGHALIRVLQDPGQARRVAARAKEDVRLRFAADSVAARMNDVYRLVAAPVGTE
jgi:glycosyltransferase involved in cell wall biosynthesis